MTRRGRLSKLEARPRPGAALEVWQEDEDAPGNFRQVFPRVGATKDGAVSDPRPEVLRREDVEARNVARLIFVEYVKGGRHDGR